MNIVILGIDLGKNSCSVVGLDETGGVALRRRMRRDGVIGLAAKLPPCTVAMEACCGAHHMGRTLAAHPFACNPSVLGDACGSNELERYGCSRVCRQLAAFADQPAQMARPAG